MGDLATNEISNINKAINTYCIYENDETMKTIRYIFVGISASGVLAMAYLANKAVAKRKKIIEPND
jgi:hypothetical protein